ncbi:MAG: sugar phosphate isomerase/epimerase [Anaerolineaceae bacterium]|nr:sugar phosphate isomerase/epimerase [Anaerolineaceae bacterium]
MKPGVITDGISRNPEHAFSVMNEFGLEYAELQYVDELEVGDLNDTQTARLKDLLQAHGLKVSCVSRHVFAGLALGELERDSAVYRRQLEYLRRCIEFAQALDCPLVRVMSFRKEMILFGASGADEWIVTAGAWDKLVHLMAPAVEIAGELDAQLVVENGNNAMITSAWLGRKLIEELDTTRLKLLWDPGNGLYCNEPAWPDAYQALAGRDGSLLAHLHIKDVIVNIPQARSDFVPFGHGDIGPRLPTIAAALRRDGYEGVVSLESVYRPPGGTFEDGFRASVGRFLEWYG